MIPYAALSNHINLKIDVLILFPFIAINELIYNCFICIEIKKNKDI
jgi:hypothetical protein